MSDESLSLSSERSDFSKSLQGQVSQAISDGIDYGADTARAYSKSLGNTVINRASLIIESGVNKAFGNNPLSRYAGRAIGSLARNAINGLLDSTLDDTFESFSDSPVSQPEEASSYNTSSRRTTLSDMEDRKDPLLSIDWVAFIRDNGSDPIESIYIDSVQLPSIRIEQSNVYRYGVNVNYAGGVSVDNCTINLFNDRTGKALKFASSWLNAVYNFETGNYGSPSEYKKDITVFLLTVTGEIVCVIDLIGCFPASFNSISLTNSTAELMPVVLDLSVDMMYLSGA